MATPEPIAAAIIARAALEPEVMGAHLGMAVKAAFPSANLKAYGGLRRFIEQFCAGKLRFVRKHGLDDVYSLLTDGSPPPEAQTSPALNAWQAITNPTSLFAAYANPQDGSLTVLPAKHGPPVGSVTIPKVTQEEHIGIARAFLPQLDAPDRGVFEEALGGDNSWQKWVRQTNTFESGKVQEGMVSLPKTADSRPTESKAGLRRDGHSESRSSRAEGA